MSRQLINHSQDLTKLENEGYEVTVTTTGYLVVHNVPYVNANKEVKCGKLVSELDLAGNVTTTPKTHVVMFSGEYPCDKDGHELNKIMHSSTRKEVGDGIVIDHTFSSKLTSAESGHRGYLNYHEKMETYVNILSSHAQVIDQNATAKTFRVIESNSSESIFNYIDTASSRAGITAITNKLELAKIGIVGLGGTGSYILDLVAKTPVKEIHLFDGDKFLQHNAFRSPGAASIEELKEKPKKVHYLMNKFSPLRKNIFANDFNIDESNIELLREMSYIFLCIDGGRTKKPIIDKLEEFGLPFIDVGMGIELTDNSLRGILRVTTSSSKLRDHIRNKHRIPFSDMDVDNIYSNNIQVADLNALNAALAVIKWKKMVGFYADLEGEHFSAYTIDGNSIINEDQA